MKKRLLSRIILAFLILLAGHSPQATAQALEPIVYTVRIAAPETQYAEVEVKVPARRRASIEVMMAVWSPGFYRVEDYASRVEGFSARTPNGVTLEVRQTRQNRWEIRPRGAPAVILSYRLLCNRRSVTTNWVGDEYVKQWFWRALASTEELDYTEALDWFGLRFTKSEGQHREAAWKLEVAEEAPEAQKSRLRQLLKGSRK